MKMNYFSFLRIPPEAYISAKKLEHDASIVRDY